MYSPEADEQPAVAAIVDGVVGESLDGDAGVARSAFELAVVDPRREVQEDVESADTPETVSSGRCLPSAAVSRSRLARSPPEPFGACRGSIGADTFSL
jgi:hypothetical protein